MSKENIFKGSWNRKSWRAAASLMMALLMVFSLLPTSTFAPVAKADPVVKTGDTLTYTISYTNPTPISRSVTIVDTLPAHITVVNGTISNGGTLSNGVITWNLTAAANYSGSVSFRAVMDHEAAHNAAGENTGNTITNNATVTVHKIPSSSSESDVSLPVSTSTYIIRNPIINGSVVNGTITNETTGTTSNGDVRRNSTQTFQYYPNTGYLLSRLEVDNVAQNLANYPDSYSFYAVQDDHTIKAIYAAPTMSKAVAPTENVHTDTADTDTVVYTIVCNNPTEIARTVKLVDTMPKYIRYVGPVDSFSVPDEVVYDRDSNDKDVDYVLTWNKTIPANSSITIKYYALAHYEAAAASHTNTAACTYYPIAGSTHEVPVTISAQSTLPVVRNPIVTGTVTGGTIINHVTNAPSDNNVHRATGEEYKYYPDSNKLLKSVTVDGSEIDVATYVDGYTFNNIREDHTIDVVYEEPTATKTVVVKESESGYDFFAAGDTVTFTITLNNPTHATRVARITDPIPQNTEVIRASISDGGSIDWNNNIIWDVTIAPSGSKSVSFDAIIDHDTAGITLDNTAEARYRAIEGALCEWDSTIYPEVHVPVVLNPKITTEVVNGTITPSMEDLERGSTQVIEYAPNEGNILKRIYLDGTAIDPLGHMDSYTFTNLQLDHTVKVVYEPPTAEKTEINSETGEAADIYYANQILTYTIKITNNSELARVYDVTDELPVGLTYIDGSVSHDGVYSDGVLTWTGVAMEPNTEINLTFNAQLNYDSGGNDVNNVATVLAHKIAESNTEQDVTVYPNDEVTVKANPVVTTSVEHGTITPTNENVERGSDYFVDYEPDEGYLLESVKVDGEFIQHEQNPDLVVFRDIQIDHTVDVVYIAPIATKTSEPKDATKTTYMMNDVVVYTIYAENTTSRTRTVNISDPLPEGCTVVDGTISDGGTYDADTNTITWPEFELVSHGSKSVSFEMVIGYEQGGKDMTNGAEVTFSKLPAARVEKDVTIIAEDTLPIEPNPVITTSVINGTITDTIESAPRGEDSIIDYAPNSGYLLKRITVDSQNMPINQNPDSYTFSAVQDDHTIEVEYVAPTSEKTSVKKINANGLAIYGVGDTLTYSIKVVNETPIVRSTTITDTMNDGISYVAGSASDNGAYDDATETITWEIEVPANGSKTVTFDAVIQNAAASGELSNSANVVIHKIPGSNIEEDVTLTPEDTQPIDRNPKIDTEVVNGTITPSMAGVDKGTDPVIEYAPNNGYLLSKVTVDETDEIDITQHPDSYTFENIQEDHTIKAEFAEPRSEKTSTIKGLDPSTTTPVEYQVNDIVVYTIKVVNTTAIDREVVIFDAVPSFAEVDASSVSDGGVANGNNITWNLTVPRLSSKSVTFEARITNTAELDDVKNIADVTFKAIPGSTNEQDVTQHPEETFSVAQNPSIDTIVSGGTITPSIPDVERGTDPSIEYRPNEGYILKEVIVDGTAVDINDCPDNYIFQNIQEDHVISVTFIKPNTYKTVEIKENNEPSEQFAASDVVTYTIGFENDTDAERSITITDVLPETLIYVGGSASDGGTEDMGTITWRLTVPAHDAIEVTFDAIIAHVAGGGTIVNTPQVSVLPIPGSSQDPTVIEPTSEAPVIPNPRIDTAIENGTITPSIDNAERGSDTVIEFTPNEGYVVGKIIVDGVEQDITQSPNGYVFENVQADHMITVQCVKPTATKEAEVKESGYDGSGYVSGDTVTYTITVNNPSSADRLVTIEDALPNGLSVVDGSISDNGSANGNTVSWSVTVPANSSKAVTVDVKIAHDVAGTTVHNVATVTVHKLDGSTMESDVVIEPDHDMPVKKNPKIDTEVDGGTITDSMEDIERGSSPVIEYEGDPGTQLKRVLVDGEEVDITGCPDSYTFDNIQADHKIRAEFEAPTAEKTATVKDSENTEGGFAADDVVTYSIEITNPSSADRKADISDTIPQDTSLVEGTITDGGTESGGTITWKDVVVPAKSTKVVSFDVRISGDAGDGIITNQADVKLKKLPGATKELDADLTPISEIEVNANPSITTEVVNGTITPSDDNVPRGSSPVVEYVPDDGYILQEVLVDGQPVDIATHPDEYVFERIQKNHTVKVTFIEPKIEKSAVVKAKDDSGSETNTDADEVIVSDGKLVTFEMIVTNDTPAERSVTVVDVVPSYLEVQVQSISNGGKLDAETNTITWDITVHQNNTSKMTFNAVLRQTDELKEIDNIANAIFHPLPGSENERDTTVSSEITVPVLPKPIKHAYDESGNLIDDEIIAVGDTIKYVITVENTSGVDKEFEVRDYVPTVFDVDTATISDSGTIGTSNLITWNITVPAESTKDVSFNAKLNTSVDDGQTIRNTAVALVDEAVVESDPCDVYNSIDPVKVAKSNSSAAVYADGNLETVLKTGTTFRYEITAKNPTASEKEFKITDVVPEGITVVAISDAGEHYGADNSIRWTVNVPAKGSKTVFFDVKIKADSEGMLLVNKAKVSIGGKEFESNEVRTPVMVTPVKDIMDTNEKNSINGKTLKAEDEALYTIKVTNPASVKKTVIVTDQVPKGLIVLGADNNGKFDSKSNTVKWQLEMEPGEVRMIATKVKVTIDTYWENRVEKIENGVKTYSVNLLSNVATLKMDGSTLVSNEVQNPLEARLIKLMVTNNFTDHNSTLYVTYGVSFPQLEGTELSLSFSNGMTQTVRVTNGRVPTTIRLKDNESFTINGIPEGAQYDISYTAVQNYTTVITGEAKGTLQKDGKVDFTHSTKGNTPYSGPTGKTGDIDSIGTWIAVMVAAIVILAGAGIYVIAKKKRDSKVEVVETQVKGKSDTKESKSQTDK